MSVTNRKMFRSRNARNKLNQMGGIMASSPELMNTVQRFQQGGSIYANQPSMITSIMDFFKTGDSGSGVGQIQRQNAMARAGITPEDFRRVQAATQANQIADAVSAAQSRAVPPGNLNRQIQNIESQLSDLGAFMTPSQLAASEARRDRLTEAQTGRLAEDVFGEGYDMLDPFMMPGVTPSSKMPTRDSSTKSESESQTTPESEISVFAGDQQTKDVEAAKRGEMGAAEQVKAVVQQGTPEEQQDQLKTLMAEFTSNAPKFSGVDKGLALAKIGFAMAAGQSPRALTNIANALNQGADALIKDKRERDAFNRQVQLSALQYGLGEIGKQRAQERLDARTFKEYAAGEDGIEYNGQTYNEGETILVSQADILANGGKLPSGLLDKTVYASNVKAAADRTKAIAEALKEQAKAGQITDSVLDKRLESYQKASNTVISAEAGIQLTENAILDVAEGRVTGLNNALGDLMNRTANSIGIDLGKEYESVADFRSDVRQVFQEMIPVTLGEAQSANSISNRDVEFLADAFITAGALDNGVFSLAAVDQDVLVKQLQGAIRKMRTAQQQAIGQMSSIEGRLAGRTVAGEQAESFLEPYRVTVEPYLPTQTGSRGVSAQGQPITSTLGFPMVGQDDQGRNVYDLTGGQ